MVSAEMGKRVIKRSVSTRRGRRCELKQSFGSGSVSQQAVRENTDEPRLV